MKRVLHLRQVTQCAMLEDFGIFLVLADKALFAYHIEALVPSSTTPSTASTTPQKLNGHKDVQFFSVGSLHGRTLIIYMKKKGVRVTFTLSCIPEAEWYCSSTVYSVFWSQLLAKLQRRRRILPHLAAGVSVLRSRIGSEYTE